MASQKKSPAPLEKAAGLGSVVHDQAINIRVVSNPLVEIQEKFIARRSRLPLEHARLVASLVFGEVAA